MVIVSFNPSIALFIHLKKHYNVMHNIYVLGPVVFLDSLANVAAWQAPKQRYILLRIFALESDCTFVSSAVFISRMRL